MTIGSFIYYIYYYICLLKIDLTDSVLKTQKEILRLETSEKKRIITSYIIFPLTVLSMSKVVGIPFNKDAIPIFIFMGAVAIVGYIIRVKRILPNEYRKIKSYLGEIEETDKE